MGPAGPPPGVHNSQGRGLGAVHVSAKLQQAGGPQRLHRVAAGSACTTGCQRSRKARSAADAGAGRRDGRLRRRGGQALGAGQRDTASSEHIRPAATGAGQGQQPTALRQQRSTRGGAWGCTGRAWGCKGRARPPIRLVIEGMNDKTCVFHPAHFSQLGCICAGIRCQGQPGCHHAQAVGTQLCKACAAERPRQLLRGIRAGRVSLTESIAAV